MTETKARELADELLRERKENWEKRFDITGAPSDEVIVIIRRRKKLLEKKAFDDTRVSLQPPGTPCPRCGGTGVA